MWYGPYFLFYDELNIWMGISMLNFKTACFGFSKSIHVFSLRFQKINVHDMLFCSSLKRGAYCFATLGRSMCRSVGGRSVDQKLKCQGQTTLLTHWVVRSISFDPFTCSKVKVKPIISTHCVVRSISWPLHLINSKLGSGVVFNE